MLAMQQESWIWTSTRLSEPARVVRWGHFGTPVLLFPTAGGDAEEVERFHLVGALADSIERGRIKVFSVDGSAARTWLCGTHSPEHCAQVQTLYDAYIDAEVVPLIRRDCHSDTIEIIAAGAALGAYNAVATLCRLPSVFRVAIGLSGIFDLSKYLVSGFAPALEAVSPLHSLRHLAEGATADALRRRLTILATGAGDYEQPTESERMSAALSAAHVNHNLENWGRNFAHGWNSWREMLPRYVGMHA
jgi:esterase/lipase superfamily enzyme